MGRALVLFLYGTPNLMGTVLALGGLGLLFAGIIQSYWPVIVAGLYALGYLGTPGGQKEQLRFEHALTLEEMQEGLLALEASLRKRVSEPVLVRMGRIRDFLLAILPQLDTLDQGSHPVHVIRQTITVYLPEMFERYLALPPAYARMHVIRDGKTPRDFLLEQLDLLEGELQRILHDIHGSDAQSLIAHGRFLKEKFAQPDWLGSAVPGRKAPP
ncbi:MAG: hypothetical protein H7831_07685 [Magnetococcus sp. WYHC-3]